MEKKTPRSHFPPHNVRLKSFQLSIFPVFLCSGFKAWIIPPSSPPSVSSPLCLHLPLHPFCFFPSCFLPSLPSPPRPPHSFLPPFHLPPLSSHPFISAQWGLAVFLSDVWKCQQCEVTEAGTARQSVKLPGYSGPGESVSQSDRQTDTMERQKGSAGLGSNSSMRGFLQHHNLEFSSFNPSLCSVSLPFIELPPGWEKIDDPVYGVYYVE